MRLTKNDEPTLQPIPYMRKLISHYLRRYDDKFTSTINREIRNGHVPSALRPMPTSMGRVHNERPMQNRWRFIPLHTCMAPRTHVDHDPDAEKKLPVATAIANNLVHFEILSALKNGHIFHSLPAARLRKYCGTDERLLHKTRNRFLLTLRLVNNPLVYLSFKQVKSKSCHAASSRCTRAPRTLR